MTTTQRHDTAADSQAQADDTLAVLFEEIARLEAELRARDDERLTGDTSATWDAPPGFEPIAPLAKRIEQLTAELAARDETVELLLEQTRFYEEAAEARDADWGQIHEWVDEVERRLGDGGGGADGAGIGREALEAERNRSEALAKQSAADRRAWDAQRRGLEQEVARLRGAAPAGSRPAAGAVPVAAEGEGEGEVSALRARCAELERSAGEADGLRAKLADALAKLDAARVEVRQAEDRRQREQNEHEAALASLRNRMAREALAASPAVKPPAEEVNPSAVEADERIRAFRQHLQELHQREDEERAARGGLKARLARAWRHSGSGH